MDRINDQIVCSKKNDQIVLAKTKENDQVVIRDDRESEIDKESST